MDERDTKDKTSKTPESDVVNKRDVHSGDTLSEKSAETVSGSSGGKKEKSGGLGTLSILGITLGSLCVVWSCLIMSLTVWFPDLSTAGINFVALMSRDINMLVSSRFKVVNVEHSILSSTQRDMFYSRVQPYGLGTAFKGGSFFDDNFVFCNRVTNYFHLTFNNQDQVDAYCVFLALRTNYIRHQLNQEKQGSVGYFRTPFTSTKDDDIRQFAYLEGEQRAHFQKELRIGLVGALVDVIDFAVDNLKIVLKGNPVGPERQVTMSGSDTIMIGKELEGVLTPLIKEVNAAFPSIYSTKHNKANITEGSELRLEHVRDFIKSFAIAWPTAAGYAIIDAVYYVALFRYFSPESFARCTKNLKWISEEHQKATDPKVGGALRDNAVRKVEKLVSLAHHKAFMYALACLFDDSSEETKKVCKFPYDETCDFRSFLKKRFGGIAAVTGNDFEKVKELGMAVYG